MNRIQRAFSSRKAFIPFFTIGYPDLETCRASVLAAADNGADLIELGIPFSDPTAEGSVIQNASIQALQNGMTTDKAFEFAKEISSLCDIPLVFMTYANVVFAKGAKNFAAKAKESGVDGLILADLPFEEQEEFDEACSKHDLALISMVSPTSIERVKKIAENAKGFLYIVSSLGSTGERSSFDERLKSITEKAKEHSGVPAAIGFGISTPEQAKSMASLADGAIVGSAIIRLMAEAGSNAPAAVGNYARRMRASLDTL